MLVRAPAAQRALLRTLRPHSSLARPTTFVAPQSTPITRFCTSSTFHRRPVLLSSARSAYQLQTRGAASAHGGGHHHELTAEEKRIYSQKLPRSSDVSQSSSVVSIAGSAGGDATAGTATTAHDEDVDMMGGFKGDLKTIVDTFDLSAVPKEAYVLGLAGVLPYFATSAATIYCAWEMNHAATVGSGFLMSGGMAEALLHLLEPLQIGYGAVILSFLGAIHWGLEWANYGGRVGYRRYAIGVLAPAVAWPTLLLSPNSALIAQFLGFVFLYYADSTAARRGWAPPWYGMYRFVLTFIVGASIVASLIGRGEIAHMVGQVPSATARIKEFRQTAADELGSAELAMQQAREKMDEHHGSEADADAEREQAQQEEKADEEE